MSARTVWILNEGSQGHVVQSRGLLRELAKVVPVTISEVKIYSLSQGTFARSVCKRLLRWHHGMWLFRMLHPGMTWPDGQPDLLVASGPRALVALSFLSKHFGCPSVFIQGTIKVPEGTVTCIMRPDEGDDRDDIITIPLLFNEITPEVLATAKAKHLAERGVTEVPPLKALFVGESSGKIVFESSDWQKLAEFVNRSWQEDGVRWLLSTSYRTSTEVEKCLRETINPDALYDAVWYSSDPRSITKEFLGIASHVYTTMDSLTMMSEAVSSGLPVDVIKPVAQCFDLSNSHHRYIVGVAEAGYTRLIVPGADGEEGERRLPKIDYREAIDALLEEITWR